MAVRVGAAVFRLALLVRLARLVHQVYPGHSAHR
jgi:hypothetical protein